ncbi:MAG: hypothetical protein LKI42_03365 [Bacteroidales bacterium]|jgi:uncharacterized membrane protein YphA (DoxX/SURF4 family)|nr:hypothetical protein [Bacteroidales bacterium]MCI1785162.1 hypothetical protein [Bacteroidales bacterium]
MSKSGEYKNKTKRFCAVVVGITFFLAGIFKLSDPVGAGLVVKEYFGFFHTGFLDFAAKPAAVIMALAETIIGAALITGIWRRLTAYVTSAFIAFFTFITIILAIANPTMECGCFGEVIHLTHLETVVKNIILCLLSAWAFIPYRDLGRPKKSKYVSFSLVAFAVLLFTLNSMLSIPLVDFTPFDIDSELLSSQNGTDEDFDDSVTTFIYEKNGVEGSFTLDHLPDSTWKYVRRQVLERNEPDNGININILSFSDAAGNYQDELASKGKVMIISSYYPDNIKKNRWNKIAGFIENSSAAGFRTLFLCASTPGNLEKALSSHNINTKDKNIILMSAYFADFKTLISLNRSNGGATYYYQGELIRKWAVRTLPDKNKLKNVSDADQTDLMMKESNKGRMLSQSFLLYVFAIMIFI